MSMNLVQETDGALHKSGMLARPAGLWLRILASLQSTFAPTLVFMVGLAVRRKFQIS